MILFWALVIVLGAGSSVAVAGIIRFVRDGRRLGAFSYAVIGALTALLAAGLLLFMEGQPGLLLVSGILALVILILGNVIGYPILTLFLLWSGFTVLRRESRSLGNALALLAGMGLIILPLTLRLLAPPETVRNDAGYIMRYALNAAVVLLVAYFAFCFAAFVVTSWLYRWRRIRETPEAVIVLGSGLIDGRVPPLLAGRLRRGLRAQQSFEPRPMIITSGGQGADEPLPEGTAMRQFLLEEGADPGLVVAETASRNTQENLELSRALLADPQSPVLVVTSSYHVFRAALLTRALDMKAHVLGARTVWYFVPSAVLREFIGVLRDHMRFHAVAVALIIVFAVISSAILVPAMFPPTGA